MLGHANLVMELDMWWRGFGQNEYWQDLSAAEPDRAERNKASENTERWPTAGELYFESGIVLVAALGFALAMDLLLRVLGIPPI